MILGVAQVPDATLSCSSVSGITCVFLDRDGVINRKAPEGAYVSNWEHFHVLPGVPEAIAALKSSGRLVFVVTNQRGVALGLYTCGDIEALHARFQQFLEERGTRVDGFYYCPHDKDCCTCRKPLPGLFEQAFHDHPGHDAAHSIMIGDSLSDIEAGRKLGMRTVFIEGEPARQKAGAAKAGELADARVGSLSEAVGLLDA